jgi:hypothetical protein
MNIIINQTSEKMLFVTRLKYYGLVGVAYDTFFELSSSRVYS